MTGPGLQRVQSKRLSDQAVQQIRKLIIDGHLQPGEKLPSEAELGSMLDIGRSSVREALRALESQELIQVRPGAGAFVADRPFSFRAVSEAVEWLVKRKEYLAQILQVREALEGLGAATLATNVKEDVLSELEQIVQEQRALEWSESTVDRQSILDIRFHQLIAKASGNIFVDSIVGSIVSTFSQSNRAVLYLSGKMEMSLSEHQRIVDALGSRDPARAEKAIRAHIARVRDDILSVHEESVPVVSPQPAPDQSE